MANIGPRLLNRDGILYTYDQSRGKILSVARETIKAARKSRKVTNEFLRIEGNLPTMNVGDLIPRNATIVSIRANCEIDHNWVLEIHKKGSTTPIATLSVSLDRAGDTNVNVDIDKDDVIQLRASGVNIPFPRGTIEIAWRY